MTDDLLRLRTARALGWVCVRERMGVLGSVYQRWEKDGTLATTVTFMNDDIAYDVIRYDGPMPAYGESWASCEEIDAACKERGWRAQIDMDGDETRVFLFTTINGLIGTRLSAAYGPTFPAAFAEAFCEAVEAASIPSTGDVD